MVTRSYCFVQTASATGGKTPEWFTSATILWMLTFHLKLAGQRIQVLAWSCVSWKVIQLFQKEITFRNINITSFLNLHILSSQILTSVGAHRRSNKHSDITFWKLGILWCLPICQIFCVIQEEDMLFPEAIQLPVLHWIKPWTLEQSNKHVNVLNKTQHLLRCSLWLLHCVR